MGSLNEELARGRPAASAMGLAAGALILVRVLFPAVGPPIVVSVLLAVIGAAQWLLVAALRAHITGGSDRDPSAPE